MPILLIAAGGVAGVLARCALSLPFHGPALNWATLGINVLGSFLLGVLVVIDWWTPELRTALGVGFLGGFTTFSTFSVQAVLDLESGEPARALLYVGASVVAGLAAAAIGLTAGRALMS